MRQPQLFTGIVLTLLALPGCDQPEPARQAATAVYYDVPAFINAQIRSLEKEKAPLQKTVAFGQQKAETQMLTQVNWAQELAFFREIDLNKKALAGNYAETRMPLPSGQKLVYTRNPEATSPISLLAITTNSQNQVTDLYARYDQKNGLFYNREERKLQTNRQGQINAFQVTGVQKVLLFDSIHYKVISTLP